MYFHLQFRTNICKRLVCKNCFSCLAPHDCPIINLHKVIYKSDKRYIHTEKVKESECHVLVIASHRITTPEGLLAMHIELVYLSQ